MSTSTPSAIIAAVAPTFARGKASGDVLFFPSEVHTHHDAGIDFEIRLCPALLHKPALPTPHFVPGAASHEQEKRTDPFQPPYNPNLYVGELKDDAEGTEYVVLLNKYSVVEGHFLLVTKEFQSQTAPLLPGDLVQAYLLLRAARKAGQHLFAFYNCGDRSGASQAHKHIQFLPVEDEDGPPIERLAANARIDKDDKPFSLPELPFAHHIRRLALPSSATPADLEPALAGAFVELLDLAISSVRHARAAQPPGAPSYNVLLTPRHLYVVPRARETYVLAASREPLSVNALGFAGMMLVKSPAELAAVRAEGPARVLGGVAIESAHELQVRGGPEFDGDAEP
ncbi:ATP adenylyltransferase-domain-containing protein [Gloeopeniophorella convolvens]|nr:ATP adenylyltransferase-domain-containing protein [Gloeopeniophorella convolvens]